MPLVSIRRADGREVSPRAGTGTSRTTYIHDPTPEPPHHGLGAGYLFSILARFWPVKFNELVRFTHQPSPSPRADIVLMGE